jgi:hypothetical protein
VSVTHFNSHNCFFLSFFVFLTSYLINIFCVDGSAAACVDVLQITHAAISMVTFISYTACSNRMYFQWGWSIFEILRHVQNLYLVEIFVSHR